MCMEWQDFVRQSVVFVAKSNTLKDSWSLQRPLGPRQESSALADIETVDIAINSHWHDNSSEETYIKDLQDKLLNEYTKTIHLTNIESVNTPAMERKILSEKDMLHWTKTCPAHNDICLFITQLNERCKRTHDKKLNSKHTFENPVFIKVADNLRQLSDLIDKVEPASDKHQRFGNIAFRTWFDMMVECCHEHLKLLIDNEGLREELKAYLTDSFGNRQRIDYGTGHELSFIIYLMGLTKFALNETSAGDTPKHIEQVHQHSIDLLAIFGYHYMPLCRKFQAKYRLEPAGSHGVYSLDDFQFLPFLFGSAQLLGHPQIEPGTYPEKEVAEKYKDDYLFHGAIHFTHIMKNGPFAEHSNQLWNISAVEDWSKINRGLLRKYINEVLDKFPIVQHIKFGEYILIWSK